MAFGSYCFGAQERNFTAHSHSATLCSNCALEPCGSNALLPPPRENFRFPDPFPVQILSCTRKNPVKPDFLCAGEDLNLQALAGATTSR